MSILISQQPDRDNAFPSDTTEHVILAADPLSVASASIAIPLSEVERVAAELVQAKRDWTLYRATD